MSNGAYNKGLKAYLAEDLETAMACWLPLAEAGNALAAYRVGYMHETGQGVPVDARLAARWYDKAALAGQREAMAALGSLFLHGLGVTQDYNRAYVLLSLASAHGAKGAAGLRDRAASFLSPDQLATLEREASRRFDHHGP